MAQYDFIEVEKGQVADLIGVLNDAMPEFTSLANVNWQPEQLYGALFLGFAQLSMIMKDYEPIGFIVHRWMVESNTNERYLQIWLFYIFKDKRGKFQEAVDATMDWLTDKGQQGGGVFLEMQTSRGGWERTMKKHMELVNLTFRKRL